MLQNSARLEKCLFSQKFRFSIQQIIMHRTPFEIDAEKSEKYDY